MDIIKINGIKVRLTDIRYGSDETQTLTWATANVKVFEPNVFGPDSYWYDFCKVKAKVKLNEGDTFNFETGCKLALNILKRKAINRFANKIAGEKRDLTKSAERKREVLDALAIKHFDLSNEFKELA